MSGAGAAAGNGRWNPTKEQIGILEGLYKQGLRTPTAEQVHQITARLRAYGHIEGKNVFYWFQNHKARQRHRERQEILLNRCFHRPLGPPLHHFSPCPSVVCRPYYNDEYQAAAASQVMVPCGFKLFNDDDEHMLVHQKTTLQLFPLLPMNNQDSVEHKPSHHQTSTEHKHQPFFDFFTNKTTTYHEY